MDLIGMNGGGDEAEEQVESRWRSKEGSVGSGEGEQWKRWSEGDEEARKKREKRSGNVAGDSGMEVELDEVRVDNDGDVGGVLQSSEVVEQGRWYRKW